MQTVFEVPYQPEPRQGCFGKTIPPLELLQLLDLGGQASHQKNAELSEAFGEFRKSATAIFLVVPLGDFDVIDPPLIAGGSRGSRGLDRFHQSLRLLDALLSQQAAQQWHKPSKTLVVFMNKYDIFKSKIETGGVGRQVAAYESAQDYPWRRSAQELQDEAASVRKYMADVDREIDALSLASTSSSSSTPSSADGTTSKGEALLAAKRALRAELGAHLVTLDAASQKYTGPDGDADAAYAYFSSLMEQRIHTAIRKGSYGTSAQYKILRTTAVDFEAMRGTCRSIVDDFLLKTMVLADEMGIIGNDWEGGGAGGGVSNPIAVLGSKSGGGGSADLTEGAFVASQRRSQALLRQAATKRTSAFDISTQYEEKPEF